MPRERRDEFELLLLRNDLREATRAATRGRSETARLRAVTHKALEDSARALARADDTLARR